MEIVFTRQAIKDFEKVKQNSALLKKVQDLLPLIELDPYKTPPAYEKLLGLDFVYSRRINIQHRLVYQVLEKEFCIKIIRM